MKQRTIQSQTTRPCCTEPTDKDIQIPFWEHLWANLVDSIKMLALIFTGYALFIFFGYVFQILAAWLRGIF
ncbi:hypothetical protein QLH32_05220 [Acinetobacter corruptisaponis]|uniref:Uncharacterized protein n=1 Tax=Acinetobacter corruptisaponis TaxID=3045147 RepID=A0ABY8S591_9GAMM|nr:hypothetical protein [Acinetobacter sp. KCTC 92772]WHP06872.1 hypothetical protein QLH32_05220 [Acinetobacter sp. KCTC 92772]